MFEQRKQDKLLHEFAQTDNFHYGLVAYHMSNEGKQAITDFLDSRQPIPQELMQEVSRPVAVIFNREAGIVAFATEKIRDWAYNSLPNSRNVQRYTA